MVACLEIDEFCAHEARIFTPAPAGARIFLTKAPRDILLAEAELERSPDLHLIYMIRDPRNVVVSRHRRAPDRYWAGLKFWKAYTPVGRRLKDHPRFITVRFEDLLADADTVQRELIERLPFLSQRTPFSRYHEVARPGADAVRALSGVRPITRHRTDQWRDHLPRIAGPLALHGSLAADLIEFGYETNDDWMRELDGVIPATRPGFWPEFFTEQSPTQSLDR
jgi:hypothetical protein